MNLVISSGWLEYFTNRLNAHYFAEPIKDTGNLIVSVINYDKVFKRVDQLRGEETALEAVVLLVKGFLRLLFILRQPKAEFLQFMTILLKCFPADFRH